MRSLPLLLALVTFAARAEDWTREDTYRQAALTTLLIADWAQSRWAIKHNEKTNYCASGSSPCTLYEEDNPLLGKHPSVGKANNLIAASIVGHAAIAYLLPRGWREGWQYVWIGVEANAVFRNRAVGVKLEF